MFGSQAFRAAAGLVVGAAGVLVLSFSLLVALAAPAASAAAPVSAGMFAPSAPLSTAQVDDLRATSRVSSAPRLAVRAALRAADAAVLGA